MSKNDYICFCVLMRWVLTLSQIIQTRGISNISQCHSFNFQGRQVYWCLRDWLVRFNRSGIETVFCLPTAAPPTALWLFLRTPKTAAPCSSSTRFASNGWRRFRRCGSTVRSRFVTGTDSSARRWVWQWCYDISISCCCYLTASVAFRTHTCSHVISL